MRALIAGLRAIRTRGAANRAWLLPAAFAVATLAAVTAPRAEWLQPDPTYRDAQVTLRIALRDTAGHAGEPGPLDSLGVALMRLGRTDEAAALFRRVLEMRPGDDAAEAGLGKLALFADRTAEAESLLTAAGTTSEEPLRDLYATRLRRGEWSAAAAMSETVNDAGRAELLRQLAEREPYRIAAGPDRASLIWSRAYPVPLVRARINNEVVLMAVDPGAGDLLIDNMWAKRIHLRTLPGQSLTFWSGSRFAVRHAVLDRIELNKVRVENIPVGVLNLHRWSNEVNPLGEPVAGVIGINLLRRFTPTLDFKEKRLELLPLADGVAAEERQNGTRIPFELWGENELMVKGSIAGGRRMSLVLQPGIPGCGFAAPSEVFDELGIRAGTVSRVVKGAGTWLQGRPWVGTTAPSIVVGTYARDRVPAWSNAFDSAELWRHGVRRDGALSSDFFSRTRLTIDWARHELILTE